MNPGRWEQIERLYHAAAELEAGARGVFLERACGGDAELRNEVESLLAGVSASEGFLEETALEIAARELSGDTASESSSVRAERIYGHYRVLEKLGEGGMGAVYLAEDPRLGRKVALKFLPPEFTGDPTALERFRTEARASSALNHPNICAIYDIGEAEGQPFLVMELLEGETLSQLVNRQAMAAPALVELAIQIADALEAAHSEGIIHRDIKPSNLFVTRRGQAKVLDFGVAKLRSSGAERLGSEDERKDQTARFGRHAADPGLTWPGLAVGTTAYMSPEQTRGEELDGRTDLFSFGAVLYEMATGRPALAGKAGAEVDKSNRAVPVSIPQAPPKLAKIIRKAMDPNREARYQTAPEIRSDLLELRRELEFGHAALAKPRLKRWMAVACVAVLLGGAAIWLLAPRFQKQSPPPQPVPFTTFPGHETDPAFSPDGNRIAFAWDVDGPDGGVGKFSVYVQAIGESTPVRLTAGPADRHPVWTPDGRWITFVRGTNQPQRFDIVNVPAGGGSERKLTGLDRSREPRVSWSPDGKELALTDGTEGVGESVFLMDAIGGPRRRLTFPRDEQIDMDPAFSPDGRTVSFIRRAGSLVMDLYAVPGSGGSVTRLTHENKVISHQAWTADGRRILFSLQWEPELTLWTVPSGGGSPEPVTQVAAGVDYPAVAPKGGRVAYSASVFNENIWRYDLPGPSAKTARPPAKWIASSRTQDSPQFSPDGQKIAFISSRSGSAELWVCNADGSKPVRLTSIGGYRTGTPRWSPDGARIVFDSRLTDKPEIYTINSQGGELQRLTNSPAENVVPSWAHDGRWIYFSSRTTGPFEIWRVPATGGSPAQITSKGGFEPFESPDGGYIYYTKSKGMPGVWRVPAKGGEETPVPELASAGFPRYWTMGANGVYFVPAGNPPRLRFWDFGTRRVRELISFPKPPVASLPGLAVSPDGRWVLYSQVDEDNADIMLLENFR